VIVDDYDHFTWVIFFETKQKLFDNFVNFCTRIENERGIKSIKFIVIMEENLKI
jgi:hypothetical protein